MMLEVLEACPALANGAFKIDDLIQSVIIGSGENLSALEEAIKARGAIDDQTAAGFMAIGAMAEVAHDLVGERKELVDAGRAVGRLMRSQYKKKIAAELESRRGAAS